MKRLVSAGIVAMVLMVLVGLYAVGPVVSCETELPKACLEAVERQSKGVYSPKLPLIPVRVSVTGYEEETVFTRSATSRAGQLKCPIAPGTDIT